jgi:hypothetical protein
MRDAGSRGRSDPGTPRWVKVSAIIAFVLIVLVVVVLIVGGGRHGPGRHFGSEGAGGNAAPAEVPGLHTPPPGVPGHGMEHP